MMIMLLFMIQLSLLLIQTHTFTITIHHAHVRLAISTTTTTTTIHSKKPKKGRNTSGGGSGGGKGFGTSSTGNNNNNKSLTIKVRQTYGLTQQPKDAFIDIEAAMGNFFRSKEEWHPLFALVASASASASLGGAEGDTGVNANANSNVDVNDNFPASEFLKMDTKEKNQELLFGDGTPWEKLPQVPSGNNKDELMDIIAKVLDASQQALVEIPVNEASLNEDENDMHFIEEGRRILCLNRFQVLSTDEYLSYTSTLERHDKIFSLVWSEIYHLLQEDVVGTGSLVILPDVYDIADLKQFTDMNVLRPLEWLGIESNIMEVASLQRDRPCIRLLYKLSDIPSLETRDNELKEEEEGKE